MKTPRPYQSEARAKIAAHKERSHALDKSSRGIVYWATGLGKSFFAMLNLKHNYSLNKHRNLFLAPDVNLVHQFAANAVKEMPEFAQSYHINKTYYPGVGTVMARHNQANARLVVGSVDTLIPSGESPEEMKILQEEITAKDIIVDKYGGIRVNSDKRPYLVSKRFDEILKHGLVSSITLDEAHHAIADKTMMMLFRLEELRQILSAPPIDIIGLTATPIRADGSSMGSLFDVFYDIRTTDWAQKQGYLAPFADPPAIRIDIDTEYAPVDMKHVLNWDEQIYEALMDNASDRQILIYMDKMPGFTGVTASQHLARYLSEQGFPAVHTDGTKTVDECGNVLGVDARQVVYERFMNRDIRAVVSYGVGLEGLDLPIADCVAIFRRTTLRHIIIQMIGRVLRNHPGKKDALILDGVGRSIDVSPIGSLMGWTVTKDDVYQIDESPDDEEDLPSVAMPDFDTLAQVGRANIYTPVEIRKKSKQRWYEDDETGRWILSLNFEGDVFCLEPPDTSRLIQAKDLLEVYSLLKIGQDNPYTEHNANLYQLFENRKHKTEQEVDAAFHQLQYLVTIFSNYTLWWANTSRHNSGLVKTNFLAYNEDPLAVVLESNGFLDDVPGVTQITVNARQRWFEEDPTFKQKQALERVGLGNKITPELTRGDASGMITTKYLNPILKGLLDILHDALLQV